MNAYRTDVLITGAGPTGLMMACQLSRYNIPFRIIDKNPGPSEKSKALAVQARTLEIYDQMDIANVAIEEGHKATGFNLVVKGKKIQRIPFGDIGKNLSPFPFLHIFEQNKNEKLLIDYLQKRNISVEWNTELLQLSQDDKEVTILIKNNNEQQEIKASWLIGADGGKSAVRHLLNLPFIGDTYENIFYVADTAVEWGMGYNEFIGYFSAKTLTGFFPMKGEKRFRLVGILPRQFQNEDHVTFEDIQSVIKSSMETKIDFHDTKWFSVYKLHHRCVNNFRSGRCFLAGDAAHIHSPAGGQGMNTGLQDAYNLAWKLVLVVKNISGEQLLDTYNLERLPFAKRLVKTTDRAFGFGVSENRIVRFLRLHIFPGLARYLLKKEFFRTFAFKAISQIAIHYRSSPLSYSAIKKRGRNFNAGDRLPYCFVYSEGFQKQVSIYDLLKEPVFHILIFDRKNTLNEKINSLMEFLSSRTPGLFKLVRIPYREENKSAFEKLDVKDFLLCIVRPDNYAGYISETLNEAEIKQWLHKKYMINLS